MSYAPAYPSSHRRSKSTILTPLPPPSSPFPSFASFRRPPTSSAALSSVGGPSSYPTASQAVTTAPVISQTRRHLRTYLKTVLDNPESRKIFWFLVLNLGFMLVQLGWGVWTNSLGLISDAIHMFFDCLALGVGLFASVMAAWKPNAEYTYGYGRVETLSGFANGVFLILISVFIVFEAVQRIVDPPEMNTNQLLLVSSIGLAINLFGMFATGGHAHHGHSHGGGHSHGAPKPKPQLLKTPQTPSAKTALPPPPPSSPLPAHGGHSHSLAHGHGHGHAHGVDEKAPAHGGHSHAHAHAEEKGEQHHGHSHGSPMPPPPTVVEPAHAHSHADHGHGHGHGHDDHDECDDDDHDHDAHGDHGHSANMRGVFLHVLADTMGSVGVIVSTLLIHQTGWTGWDPVASLFIAALITASVVPLVVDAGRVLALDVGEEMERDVRVALSELRAIPGLASYGAPRFWPKDESTLVGSIHIHLSPLPSSSSAGGQAGGKDQRYADVRKVVGQVRRVLGRRLRGLGELTVQVEGGREGGCWTC